MSEYGPIVVGSAGNQMEYTYKVFTTESVLLVKKKYVVHINTWTKSKHLNQQWYNPRSENLSKSKWRNNPSVAKGNQLCSKDIELYIT